MIIYVLTSIELQNSDVCNEYRFCIKVTLGHSLSVSTASAVMLLVGCLPILMLSYYCDAIRTSIVLLLRRANAEHVPLINNRRKWLMLMTVIIESLGILCSNAHIIQYPMCKQVIGGNYGRYRIPLQIINGNNVGDSDRCAVLDLRRAIVLWLIPYCISVELLDAMDIER